jgi:8-oxo-dGTP diphosphatase
MPKPQETYVNPAVTVDAIVFTIRQNQLQVALIKRGIEPFLGTWAIPGGFVQANESLEAAVTRELAEEVGVHDVYLEQLYTFGHPLRDPRGRVITVAYFALLASENITPLTAATDAAEAQWFPCDDLPPLAFDHREILDLALERLRAKLEYSTVAFALLPQAFTLTQLQKVYETILSRPIDKRNFRKKILSLGFLEETQERSGGAHRPATLYTAKTRQITLF